MNLLSAKGGKTEYRPSSQTGVQIEDDDLDKLKQIQATVKKTFRGINVKYCGRIGNCSIVNAKHKIDEMSEDQLKD